MRGTNEFIRGLTNTAFMYKGSYDSIPESWSIGDVVIVDGSEYVYSETGWKCMSRWTDISRTDISISPFEDRPQHMIPKTCTQCGAVLRGSACEYCGTIY